MATKSEELETRIREVRSRFHSGTIDGQLYESITRLNQLSKSLKKLDETIDDELYRHFPVAVIAVLETHFKSLITSTIDSGAPYLDRGLVLAKEKLKTAMDVLPSLHKKTVTLGEFIAYTLPFNSLSSIEQTLSILLSVDLKEAVRHAKEPGHERNQLENRAAIVQDVNELWRALAKTFERRHILAHEAASNYQVTRADALLAVNAAIDLVNALDSIMWSTVWKDTPLTQREMNDHAFANYKKTRKSMAKSLHEAFTQASENGERARFRSLHLDWKRVTKALTDYETERWQMGSIRPLMVYSTLEQAYSSRLTALQNWITI